MKQKIVNSLIGLVETMASPEADEKDKTQASDRFCELIREISRDETNEILEEAA